MNINNNKNKDSNKNSNIIPLKTYFNLIENKYTIYKENRYKSGVYRLNNLKTGKCYIGSSINLDRRFSCYFSLTYLKRKVYVGKSAIYSSILKHGYSNFSLDILEYCDPSMSIKREQYYMDNLNPTYNILKTAGLRLGGKNMKVLKKKRV